MDPTRAFYCQSSEARGTELPAGGSPAPSSVSSGVGHGLGMAVPGAAPAVGSVRAATGEGHAGGWAQPGCAGEGLGHGGGQHSSSLTPLVGASALGAPAHSQSILPGTSELGLPVAGAPGARGCSRTEGK